METKKISNQKSENRQQNVDLTKAQPIDINALNEEEFAEFMCYNLWNKWTNGLTNGTEDGARETIVSRSTGCKINAPLNLMYIAFEAGINAALEAFILEGGEK